MTCLEAAQQIGGDRLVRLFDLVQVEQRKRWSCPDWRQREAEDADLTNFRDLAAALEDL